MKVYLSPSTQEYNIGYGSYGTEEARMNEVASIMEEMLTVNGFEIKRNTPDMKLSQVVTDSNNYKPDIHIAVHSNASNTKARGCEVWYYDGSQKGMKLAMCIYEELSAITPPPDRGIHPTKTLYELSHTSAPAVIVEVSFHDNPEDAQWILSHEQGIAEAIVKGICAYFGHEYIRKDIIYRVEIGDWHKKSTAVEVMNKIKSMGYPAWVVQIEQ